MGKRYRKNSNGEWEEVDQDAEDGAMFLIYLFFVGIGLVLWAPIQILAQTPVWTILVMPCVISFAIYLLAPYEISIWLNIVAWVLILVDIFLFDSYCLSLYFEPLKNVNS